MEDLKKEITNINSKVDKMYYALMGSDITKDGGLVARVVKGEQKIETLKDEVEEIKKKNAKIEVYQRFIWGAVGSSVTLMFTYVINILIK